MTKFYDNLNSLQCNVQCVICQEQFPFITLPIIFAQDVTEIDTTFKLYSAGNNMDPGALPNELMECALIT